MTAIVLLAAYLLGSISGSLLLGRQIRARHQGVEVFGRVVDLDEEGRLRLERADGGTLLLDSAENVRQVF